MTQSVLLDNALCLPIPDVEALTQGRIIAAVTRTFIEVGRTSALLPSNILISPLPVNQTYCQSFLATAQNVLSEFDSQNVTIKAWARCEQCQIINESVLLERLSKLTIWTIEALQQILILRPYIFLTYLRVYSLPSFKVRIDSHGQYVTLPSPLSVNNFSALLSERTFAQRRYQLENLLPPLHPELEELQSIIEQSTQLNPTAKSFFSNDLKYFLGWTQYNLTYVDPELQWIRTIADVGNSSDGNEFEKLVRKSFIKLGFSNSSSNQNLKDSLNPERVGGAGGLDFYCDTPYSIVGECKATKSDKVPDGTAAQLVKLGYKHLQRQYNRCIKMILAAGELTEDAELTASGNEMNVIRPETLQRLVELKAKYPGSIDLLALKPCLTEEPYGEAADGKLNRYIDNVFGDIKVRSHLIQLVKKANREVGIEYLSGSFDSSNSPKPIFNLQEMHEILVELSSPLTGYLGRVKGSDWREDRFYFLRDLTIDFQT